MYKLASQFFSSLFNLFYSEYNFSQFVFDNINSVFYVKAIAHTYIILNFYPCTLLLISFVCF